MIVEKQMFTTATNVITYNIVVLLPQHSITGELVLSTQRLSDYLNDQWTSSIILENAVISHVSDPGKTIDWHLVAIVPKATVVAAFEPPQKAIPYAKRLCGYVRKQTYQVFLILNGMNVQGTLHSSGDLDLHRILATTSDSFLPITQATVTLQTKERFVIEQDAIMVNTRLIRYMSECK